MRLKGVTASRTDKCLYASKRVVKYRILVFNVDTIDDFRVVGVAITDVSSCSFSLISYVKRPLRKLAKGFRPFLTYFGRMPQLILLADWKWELSFSVYQVNMFSTVQFTVRDFLVSSFHGNLDFQKLADLPSMNPHRGPWMDQWTVHSVTNCQYCTFSIRYLNANVSTPVFIL